MKKPAHQSWPNFTVSDRMPNQTSENLIFVSILGGDAGAAGAGMPGHGGAKSGGGKGPTIEEVD